VAVVEVAVILAVHLVAEVVGVVLYVKRILLLQVQQQLPLAVVVQVLLMA
jgi:hypothetical protein